MEAREKPSSISDGLKVLKMDVQCVGCVARDKNLTCKLKFTNSNFAVRPKTEKVC